jgi:transposase
MQVLSDAQWAVLSPLIEECRPKGKMPLRHLRRTIEAIVWRYQNNAKWRAVPKELGPWWAAAQTFIRWSKLGVWEDLLDLAQAKGVAYGIVVLDDTSIRAHHNGAGAARKGVLQRNGTYVVRLVGLVAAAAAFTTEAEGGFSQDALALIEELSSFLAAALEPGFTSTETSWSACGTV